MKVEIGGVSLSAQRGGSGAPIVLVHSLSFDGDMWEAQARALSENHDVIRLDMRGHGTTDWRDQGDVTLDDLADDVAKALDALDIPRAGYAGLSLGGMVGMRFALRHPDRVVALGLLNTSAEPEPEPVQAMYHQANEAAHGQPQNPAMAEMMMGLMFADQFRADQSDKVAPYLHKLLNRHDAEGLYQVSKAVIWRKSVLDDLAAISVPTLVVTSDIDRAIPASRGEAIAKAIPNSRHVAIEGAGHMTAVERPDVVTHALRELFS